MTVQKSFNDSSGTRMAQTGESYTAARAPVARWRRGGLHRPGASATRLLGVRTRRGWEEWFDLLDSWHAESMGYTELVGRVARAARRGGVGHPGHRHELRAHPWQAGRRRTVSKPNTARFDVGDGTSRLLVTVDAKGPAKSTVVAEHSKLTNADQREARTGYWRHVLAMLEAELDRDA